MGNFSPLFLYSQVRFFHIISKFPGCFMPGIFLDLTLSLTGVFMPPILSPVHEIQYSITCILLVKLASVIPVLLSRYFHFQICFYFCFQTLNSFIHFSQLFILSQISLWIYLFIPIVVCAFLTFFDVFFFSFIPIVMFFSELLQGIS